MSPARARFEPQDDGSYRPTVLAQGAWDPGEIHFSPLGGLLVHAIEQHRAERPPLQLARVGFDILGFLPLDACTIRTNTVRAGRTIELTQATAAIAGRDVAVARAWHLVEVDTSVVEGGSAEPLPDPSGSLAWDRGGWGGGFVEHVDVRVARDGGPGDRAVWVSSDVPLVDGATASPTAEWIGLIDLANGIATRVSPGSWMFPNVDLTIHLHRAPHGPLLGLDTRVAFGAGGLGTTSTVLHDEAGAVGFAMQALTVRPASR